MAHPQMLYKPHISSESTEHDSALPTHYIDPVVASHKSVVNPGFLKGLAVGLAVLAASCFSLHMFSHKHPVYLDPLQTYLASGVTRFNANYNASTDFIAGLHAHCDEGLPVPNSHLARRQAGNNKQWFFIPVSSSRYTFASHGLIERSKFRMIPFRSSRDRMVVKVEVVRDPQGSARVTTTQSSEDGEANGIEMSNSNATARGRRNAPIFDVVVYIPVPDRPLRLNSFETNLASFEHTFPDLSRYVRFSDLRLSAVSAAIDLGTQVADEAHITNLKGPITGNLTGEREIELSSENGKIDGEYTLSNAGSSLRINNTNGAISAGVRLQSRDATSSQAYHVEASNRHGMSDLTVLEQPMDSTLILDASNMGSFLRVHLNEAFEGRFSMKAGRIPPTVHVNDKDKQDPTGHERKRVVRFDEGSRKTSGQAKWEGGDDSSDNPHGNVSLTNLGSKTELFFD